ncbi:hypothetical protein Bbelb_192900 [Branchiostoma belcheri]|nr:hypothetical protein Bbelb_192900 [Branchiostoma belcheri]
MLEKMQCMDKCKEAGEKKPKSRKGTCTRRGLSDLPSSEATLTKVNRAYVRSRREEETAGVCQIESGDADEIRDGDQGSNEVGNESSGKDNDMGSDSGGSDVESQKERTGRRRD